MFDGVIKRRWWRSTHRPVEKFGGELAGSEANRLVLGIGIWHDIVEEVNGKFTVALVRIIREGSHVCHKVHQALDRPEQKKKDPCVRLEKNDWQDVDDSGLTVLS